MSIKRENQKQQQVCCTKKWISRTDKGNKKAKKLCKEAKIKNEK